MRNKLKTFAVVLLMVLMVISLISCGTADEKSLVVGSKNFTEQRILGYIMIELLENQGFTCRDSTGLGGTLVARNALENRQIDIYMEYTGTGLITILKHDTPITDPQECYETVKAEDFEKNNMVWLPYMSFNNTYCLLMQREKAAKLGIKTLSDLAAYAEANPDNIIFGTNEEFYARPDGYKPLQETYGFEFPDRQIKKMSPGLLYQGLRDGQLDVAMGFATDGRIKGFDLVVLEDDKNFFPVYNPAPVVHKETVEKYPALETIFIKLGEILNTEDMTLLNYQVDVERKSPRNAASEWLKSVGLI
ncbi:MAG: glycine betaine ABC transporter substrate-binding protein [Desulfobacterales bacterium]